MPNPLAETRKRVVYGSGNRDADIMIIGEAPGKDEDRVGRPFVGRSGQLLDVLLARVGIVRNDCYITNVVKERPPNNDISQFIDLSKRRPIIQEGFEKYRQYLLDEIRDVDPNVIVVTGNVSLFTLTGNKGITKWRGSVLESITGHKVIPIIHPAAALRQYLYQHFITFDLKKVKNEAESREIDLKTRHYIIEPSFIQTTNYLEECLRQKRVGFDIEVSHKKVSCISLAYDEYTAISIPFTKHGGEYFSIDEEYEVWTLIAKILEDESIEKIAQNAAFDTTFLFREYGIKTRNIHDTMIAMAILYPDFPKDLGFITSIYTDMPYYKDERKSVDAIITDADAFWIYNAKDSIVLMEALPRMLKDLERMGNLETYEQQRRLLNPLLYMTERGIKMDVKGMREASNKIEAELIQIEQKVNELVGRDINIRSPKQLKEYFYGDKRQGNLGIPPYKTKGKPTTDEGALIRLGRGTKTRQPLEEAQLILEYRGKHKMRSTYLEMSLDDDVRLRSAMNPVGAKTGRLSSSKTIFGTGANMQNQPPEMKRFMLVDDGYVGYEIDLGQAENRIVAYIAPEPKMYEAFEAGIDIHSRTASYIFGIPEDEIREMHKEDVKCKTIGTGDYTHRFWGKKANHAFNYGQSASAFAYQVEIPDNEGKMIHNKYHSAYAGVRKYHKWVQNKLESNRTIENLFGRKYMFLDRWDYKMFESAYAFIPQSTVGDIINRHGLIFMYERQDLFKPVEILNQVHDSIVFQIPKEYSPRTHALCIKTLVESLETPLSYRGTEFVIPCDMKIFRENFGDGEEISDIGRLSIEELTRKIEEKDAEDNNTQHSHPEA